MSERQGDSYDAEVSIRLGSWIVELTRDPFGHHGLIEHDGETYRIYCSFVRVETRTSTPAKARLLRYVNGIEQPI